MLIKRLLLIVAILLSIVHMALAFAGLVNFVNVFGCPVSIMFLQLIMHIIFTNSIKTGDFTMIAGYDEKYPAEKMTAILNSILILCGIAAVMCEVIFFAVYFMGQERLLSVVLVIMYVIFMLISIFVSNYKYRLDK